MSLEGIQLVASQFGWVVAITLAIILYLVANPSIALAFKSLTTRALYFLRLTDNRTTVGRELEATFNSMSHQLQREMPTLFSKSLRISWIRDGQQFANIEDGQVILYVKDNPDRNEILADTTMLYVKRGVNFESRPFIDRPLVESIDIALAQRLLEDAPLAYDALQEKYIQPQLERQRQRRLYELACTLDEFGVLTRVVLAEFSFLGLRQRGLSPTAHGRAETLRFAEFVKRVVMRNDDVVPLRFGGRLFNSTVALIARPEMHEGTGFRFYQRRFRSDVESGVRIIHLLGRGQQNDVLARRLAIWAKKSKLITDFVPRAFVESTSEGNRVRAICITCFAIRGMAFVDEDSVGEMFSALNEVVPETATGEIDILGISREEGVRSKILLRSSRAINPIEKCVGKDGTNINCLRKRLGAEAEVIDFILWDRDPSKLITKALYPLRESEILRLSLDKKNAHAKIALATSDYGGPKVDKHRVILRLAQNISGYDIDFVEARKIMSDEEIVKEILARSIGSIVYGQIVIYGVARYSDVCKIFIGSEDYSDSSEICRDRVDVEQLKSLLSVKFIGFAEWSYSAETRICNALTPLNPTEIVNCEVNERTKRATILVLNVQARGDAVGRKGANIKAAELLTGFRITIKIAD